MTDLIPTFTLCLTDNVHELKHKINLRKFEEYNNWYIKVHSISYEKKKGIEVHYNVKLFSSLLNILEESVDHLGYSQLVNVPLHLHICKLEAGEQKINITLPNILYKVNNLTSTYHWIIEPVLDKKEEVSQKFKDLTVTIHYSFYGK